MPTLIHISDLHLHPPLPDTGRVLLTRLGLKSHAYHVLQAGTAAIRTLMAERALDPLAVVATGDLTTAGSAIAFRLAHHVLRSRRVEWNFQAYRVGLGAEHWFVVPGNHDRYQFIPLLRQTTLFEAEFAARLPMANWGLYLPEEDSAPVGKVASLPYVWGLPLNSREVQLALIGIDSTELNRLESNDIFRRIASGRVSERSLRFVASVLTQPDSGEFSILDSGGESRDLSGGRIARIVFMHHHPYLPPSVREKSLTKLLNSTEVLQQFASAGVDMVLFGHQHVPFVEVQDVPVRSMPSKRIVFAAAGSLCQFEEPNGNSFNVYNFTESALNFEIHRFDGVRFTVSSTGSIEW